MYAHNSYYQRKNLETGSFSCLHDFNNVVVLLYSSIKERANTEEMIGSFKATAS